MWSEQLESNADTFTKEAVKVSFWDSELMENQKKLGDLAGDVRRIQVAQKELDTNLDTVSEYQKELKGTLEQLEKSVDEIFEKQNQSPTPADQEREKSLKLAIDIDDQLNTMTDSLKEIVEKLNESQNASPEDDNPVSKVLQILNVHYNSLQWVENSADHISKDITELSRKFQDSNAIDKY